jgi:hypothetical protein
VLEGEKSGGEETKVWVQGEKGKLHVNAPTLESGQPGLDLREWHEKGWILYLDCADGDGENPVGKPWAGGMY